MSIYKDKNDFFWILFFWVQHILHSTSGDFFNCEEMGTHCECSFLINDRWKIYHRLVARWIYDIQLWPPNFIGWPLTIFAGWHQPLVPSRAQLKINLSTNHNKLKLLHTHHHQPTHLNAKSIQHIKRVWNSVQIIYNIWEILHQCCEMVHQKFCFP